MILQLRIVFSIANEPNFPCARGRRRLAISIQRAARRDLRQHDDAATLAGAQRHLSRQLPHAGRLRVALGSAAPQMNFTALPPCPGESMGPAIPTIAKIAKQLKQAA
jgi:hypothetical protein